eukprot:SAG22_NODE_1893_length_3367_cov_2.848531_1_plen_31_part_10
MLGTAFLPLPLELWLRQCLSVRSVCPACPSF